MTFEEAHSKFLARLDKSYARLRAIHEDISHTNNESREYKDALGDFNDMQAQIFTFKESVWNVGRLG